jgi:hypothetical protein
VLLRRWSGEQGHLPRVAELRRRAPTARRVRVREQPLRTVHRCQPHHGRHRHLGAGSGLRNGRRITRRQRPAGRARCRRPRHCARPSGRGGHVAEHEHLPSQRALRGRRRGVPLAVAEAHRFALDSPPPDPAGALDDVWTVGVPR